MLGKDKAPPPGWYPDNTDPALEQRWDGQAWTGETRPSEALKAYHADREASIANAAREAATKHLRPSTIEQMMIDECDYEQRRRPMSRIQFMAYETTSSDSRWYVWMKWTQPNSLPYKERLACERRDEASSGAAAAASEEEKRRADLADRTIPKMADLLVDAIMEWARVNNQTTLSEFASFHITTDGDAYLHPLTDAGAYWPAGPKLVPVMHVVAEEIHNEFGSTRREPFKAFEALAIDRCQRRLAEAQASATQAVEAAAAAKSELDAALTAACDELVTGLRAAAAGRVVRKVLLASAGPRRGVVDARFTDGTSQFLDITDPRLLSVLKSGDVEAIGARRTYIEERVVSSAAETTNGSPTTSSPGLLADHVAGRIVRKVLLAAAGPRRVIADIRFIDGTSQVVDVHDETVIATAQSGDIEAIEALRRQLSEQVGGI